MNTKVFENDQVFYKFTTQFVVTIQEVLTMLACSVSIKLLSTGIFGDLVILYVR